MLDFIFEYKTELLFGKNKELLVGERVKNIGAKRVLICYGQASAKKSGLLDNIIDSLEQAKVKYFEYGGVRANPAKSHALAGIDFAKDNQIDFVLALGGGSVIDEAKCIAVGALHDNGWSFYENSIQSPTKALPIGAVLTLPAAGSENSTASVIRDEKTGRKHSIHAECIRPRFAFINPELCFSLPKNQIANGSSDILAHLMERYFSPQDNVVISDKLLTGAMQGLFEIAQRVYNDNTNYDYWSELCLIGSLAHNDMLSLGREKQDWGCHSIENMLLSGIYNTAHGTGLAIIFPAWLKYVSKTKPSKVLQFAIEIMGAEGKTSEEIISNGIKKLERFYKSLNLPVTLAEINIAANDVKKLVSTYYKPNTVLGGYGELKISDIEKVIELAK